MFSCFVYSIYLPNNIWPILSDTSILGTQDSQVLLGLGQEKLVAL